MKQKFIEWFTKNNNGCSPAMEDDRSFVYEMTQHMFEAYQAGVAEGEAKCAALAAELSAVETIHNDAVFITDEHYEQCPPEVQKMIRSLAVLQIPAYQAFLAEVRAQGVEMFAAVLRRKGDDAFFDAIAEAQANAADQFAAQLRQGGAA
ncbi:hypothetical protein M8O35_16775 [Enterobacter roggenkampii]|uniref:hypothetical protein n=1 Tax=Enterobacter roggenkampii TaxID=1812935 RepID=UPI002074E992|nr:hypothetical protein [Enterobacter roggenkampii]MCM7155503.1 hypothetical protein [Enterobacter roggenkampii]